MASDLLSGHGLSCSGMSRSGLSSHDMSSHDTSSHDMSSPDTSRFDLSRFVDAQAGVYATVLEEILRAKPAAAKGRYIKTVVLCSSMGPGIKIDPSRIRDVLEEQNA